ncbi:MAG: hypothetical protein IKE49_00865, partial [Firmicutes bacterium]|nr:hypothetical protein [Bacillota bacterium]
MKRTAKRLLTIVFSIMIVMMYMMPGSVFADDTGETADVYQLVDSLEDGGEYIISNGNDSGSFSALKNPGG